MAVPLRDGRRCKWREYPVRRSCALPGDVGRQRTGGQSARRDRMLLRKKVFEEGRGRARKVVSWRAYAERRSSKRPLPVGREHQI